MPALVMGGNWRARLGGARLGVALLAGLAALLAGAGGAAGAGVRAIGATTAAARSCQGAGERPNRADIAAIDATTLCLIDRARAAHGLGALKPNRELRAVAISQVKEMVRLDYFSDDRPSGETPGSLIASTSYGRHAAELATAENIGWGTGRDATPAEIVAAWLASPPHRAIVLSRSLSEVGVAAIAAVPARLAAGWPGATYALELARR
jgi:uncharacterized protein YkwD